ncbi:MAG: His/Gly/Thr/Pro-type tRNA ligase C-terminal domain-containing protein [Candidatus Pacebacteria bacterium]|nr:His/Gly/Thr/Pro-type tRNA ligase C-terminal domain-containing protein [Candidatus Paceibacterota bacterium]
MKQSQLFTKTLKDAPKDEKSANAQLLIRAGFVDKLASGVYDYLPLGLRVKKKIEEIVREEMNNIGGQEILMPSLTPKENWEKTGRWTVEEMYKIKDEEMGLGWTHEEIITPMIMRHILSPKDLPKYVYQIQTKFRNEPRAKSGLLRCREFAMKDLYSFHSDEKQLDDYYEKVKQAYFNIFEKCGIRNETFLTLASGGTFSEYSHEFQTITPAGEDTIYICPGCGIAINKEVKKEKCPGCGGIKFREEKAIEVGNIFKLGSRYSEPFGLKNENGDFVIMGCYGIGITRLIGTIAEVLSDTKGLVWPAPVAPFAVHLIELSMGDVEVKEKAEEIYRILQNANFEVIYDDRDDKTAGEKFNDCDLMGMPLRVVVSKKTLEKDSVEIKKRQADLSQLIKIADILSNVQKSI